MSQHERPTTRPPPRRRESDTYAPMRTDEEEATEWVPPTKGVDVAGLAARLLPLLTPCARLRSLPQESEARRQAAELIIILHQADVLFVLTDLIEELGPSALDVSEALVGVIRASIHPVDGTPTLRDKAYQVMVPWARALRSTR